MVCVYRDNRSRKIVSIFNDRNVQMTNRENEREKLQQKWFAKQNQNNTDSIILDTKIMQKCLFPFFFACLFWFLSVFKGSKGKILESSLIWILNLA